jgi:hypothetical protein
VAVGVEKIGSVEEECAVEDEIIFDPRFVAHGIALGVEEVASAAKEVTGLVVKGHRNLLALHPGTLCHVHAVALDNRSNLTEREV